MARIRSIKPEFFLHEGLAKLPAITRLGFIGLWNVADRQGKLEDRPLRLKVQIFPYDDISFDDEVLKPLSEFGFITRYEVGGTGYISIPSFLDHQIPSRLEPGSEIPDPDGTLLTHRPYFTPADRRAVYARDKLTCQYCDANLSGHSRKQCIDHVIPYSKNGSNSLENLVTCCKKCNAMKGDRDPNEAGMKWPQGFGKRLRHRRRTVNAMSTDTPPGIDNRERERIMGKGRDRRNLSGASPDPRIKEFIDFFFSEFRNRTGERYHVNGGKDGKTVQRLLKDLDLQTLKARATKFFSEPNNFTAEAGFTIGVFASQINKLVAVNDSGGSSLSAMAAAAHRHVEAGGKLP